MKVKFIVISFILLAIASLIGYRIFSNNNINSSSNVKPGKKNSGSAMRVSGVVVQLQKYSNSLSVSGSIQANEQVQIRSQVSGIVKNIFFEEGSSVTKGQVLLKIDDAEIRAQLSQASTRQELAGENERRARLLFEKEAISREEFDIAVAEFKALKAQTQLIQAQLAKTTIKAPFSGKIGLRAVSEGVYLSPETVIANLVDTDPIKIAFSVPEKYSNLVKINTELSFTVSGYTQKFKARIYAIEPSVDPLTRTLQLKARATNPENLLLPGTFANVQLPLAEIKDAILIPTEAVIPIQNGKKVYISENGKAKEIAVEASLRTDKDILILSGLKAGDTVLTSGVMSLKKDAPVKVTVSQKD